MRWRKRKSIGDSSVIRSTGYLLDAAVLEKRLLFSATPMVPAPVDGVPSDHELAVPTVELNFSDTASTGNPSGNSSGDAEQAEHERQR
ncbi:LEPR-XLL domain-containing protein [Stieleria sp.]|uniref:LEPR-XLL domain-containing protein n=1 Tax=Stieleria sp. TaxID=2795976 RepID=UPI003563EE6D